MAQGIALMLEKTFLNWTELDQGIAISPIFKLVKPAGIF